MSNLYGKYLEKNLIFCEKLGGGRGGECTEFTISLELKQETEIDWNQWDPSPPVIRRYELQLWGEEEVALL